MADSQWFYAAGDSQNGPVPEEQLKRMLASGQVASAALVWRQGMGAWQPAASVPEFAAAAVAPAPPPFPPMAAPAPYPPAPGAGFAPGATPVGAPLQYGGYAPYPPGQSPPGADPGMRWLVPVGRSGWAIAAGYFGLFSVLLLPAPLAILFALLAFCDMKKHPERHGMGRAVFGLILGILGTVGLILMLVSLGASGRYR